MRARVMREMMHPREGCDCKGYEKVTTIEIAKRAMATRAEDGYVARTSEATTGPNVRYPDSEMSR